MLPIAYDFHIHSCLSPCGNDDMTPANIVGMAMIAGLDAIAITDHNSCKNCRAAIVAGKQYGITVIPGMELCTSEEVHVVCLFRSLEKAELFSDYVHRNMLPIANTPKLFGNQFIYNEEDEQVGVEELLLISASNVAFLEADELVKEYGGIMIPAHLDKQSNSLLNQLGFIPEGSRFACFELRDMNNLHEYRKNYPYLQKCQVISDSDAHQLCDINEPKNHLYVRENCIEAILEAIERRPE